MDVHTVSNKFLTEGPFGEMQLYEQQLYCMWMGIQLGK